MKTRIQISYIKKVSRKEGDVCKGCKWIRTTLLLMPGTLIFLECSSVLNAAPVTNAFLR